MMKMMNRNSYTGLFIALAIMLTGGMAWANGNTIAGSPKTQTLHFETVVTLLSGLEGQDVCTTIVNRSEKTGLIQLTVTDGDAGTKISEIPRSKSSALCGLDTDTVAIECLGPRTCAFTWSVDKF
jgi:hypothetical protein